MYRVLSESSMKVPDKRGYKFSFFKIPGLVNRDEYVLIGVERTKTWDLFQVSVGYLNKYPSIKEIQMKAVLLDPNNREQRVFFKEMTNYFVTENGFDGRIDYQSGHTRTVDFIIQMYMVLL